MMLRPSLEDAAMTRVIEELSRLYLEGVEDPLARRALEAASVVRRATEPLLAAMLEEPDGAEAVRRLLELPFVDAGPHGLVVHEAVREAMAGFLSAANPILYRPFGASTVAAGAGTWFASTRRCVAGLRRPGLLLRRAAGPQHRPVLVRRLPTLPAEV